MNVALLILTPLIVASLLFFTRTLSRRLVESISVLSGIIELYAALAISFSWGDQSNTLFSSFLTFDALASWFLFIVALLGSLALWYSVSYLQREVPDAADEMKVRKYFAFLQLFIFAMFVAVSANNALLLWIAVEATTLCSAFLVNFFDKPAAIEAAWKYLIINTIGLLLGLFGVFIFIAVVEHTTAAVASSLNWNSIMEIADQLDVSLIKLAFAFMVIGYGTKAGLAPLHNWLPEAHSQAPAPVSALLSGALLNVAILALLRFKVIVDVTAGVHFTETIFLAFGTSSIVIASVMILIQKQYKRLLAYSSVEHMGIIVFGLGAGGLAAVAALLHALYHSLAKTLLFFASGNIALRYHESEISRIRVLLRVLPVTGVLFFAGILAVAGIPPFGTFLTEFAIFATGFRVHPVYTVIALMALSVAVAGLLRHLSSTCFGTLDEHASQKRGEDSMVSVAPLIILFVLLVILSIFQPTALSALLTLASKGL